MTIQRIFHIGLALSLMLALSTGTAFANRGQRVLHKQPAKVVKKGYVLDKRHHHNRYYPKSGYVVNSLPRGHRVVPYHKKRYYFYDGIWYRPSGISFSVVLPPVGLTVHALPRYYSTIWVGSIPYYYAAGTYYNWWPERRTYVVVEPPPEQEVIEEAELPEQLFIYPKQGQGEELQATDRYECHSWAVGQTGFDPTLPGGNVSADENASKRADYNRATKACLEARGYSVR